MRTNRGVRMTEAGEALLEEARRILVQLEQTTRVVQRVGHGEVGRLTLGFVPSASNEVLPPILRTFRNRFPDVELFLREMRPDQVVPRLHDKQIDAGFLFLPLDDALLNIECVSREPLVLALPAVASSRRKTASRATSPRRRTVHPSRALFDTRSFRTGYSGLPPGRFRSEGGTERRLAHADSSRPRRRRDGCGTGPCLLAKPSQEGRDLQAGRRPFAHGGIGHGMASRRPRRCPALVRSGG